MKASVFIATSLDGFIARRDGGLDWLDAANATVPPGEDCGFGAFIETVDVLVMGRKSFEKVLSLDVPWPYGGLEVVVLSRRGTEIPEELRDTVRLASEPPAALLEDLAGRGRRHAYIDGGETIRSFLNAGLIDEITLTLIPVLLGDGVALFGPREQDGENDIPLTLLQSKTYDCGFVQLRYRTEPNRS